MPYRSQTQVLPQELDLRLVQRAAADELQRAEISGPFPEPSLDPAEAEDLLRWLRVSFGCETG
jgi:hypothetical protein